MRKAGVWAAAVMLGLGLGLQQEPAQAAGPDQFTIVQTCAGQQFFGAAQKGSQGFGTVDYFGTLCTSGTGGGGGGGGGAVYGPTAQGAAPTGTGAQPLLIGSLDRNGLLRAASTNYPIFTTDSNVAQAFAAPGTATPNGALSVQRPDGTPVAGDGTDATGVTAPSGATGIRGWLSGIYSSLTGNLKAVLYVGSTPATTANPAPTADVNAGQTINNTGATSTKAQAMQRPDGSAVAGDGTDNTGVTQPSGGSGIRGWLSAIYSKLTGVLSVSQQDDVVTTLTASATGPFTGGDANATTGSIIMTGYQSWSAQVTSVGSGNSVTFQGSDSCTATSTDWQTLQASPAGGGTPYTGAIGTTVGLLEQMPVTTHCVRVLYSGGTGTVTLAVTRKLTPAPTTQLNATQGTNPWAVSQGTGSSVAGWGTVGATTSAGGGVQSYCRLPSSAATTNATNCKPSQGRIYKIIACNTTTTPARIKFYNTTTAPTPGTTPVAFTRPIPAAAAANGLACVSYDMSDIGWWLSTGISYAITLNAPDSDTAPLATAGAITDVSIEYQ